MQKLVPDGLIDGEPCPALGRDGQLSLQAQWRGTRVADGDIFFLQNGEAIVSAGFAYVNDREIVIAYPCVHIRRMAPNASQWERKKELVRICLSQLDRLAVLWSLETDTDIIILE